jgi:hypothetical protein
LDTADDMTTNRTPIERPALTMITPRAVALFTAMGRLRCTCPSPKPPTREPCAGCARWYDLHADLHDELQCQPWEWPCVARQSPRRAGSLAWNENIAGTMRLLEEAARRRTSSKVSKADERDTDAESITGQEPSI